MITSLATSSTTRLFFALFPTLHAYWQISIVFFDVQGEDPSWRSSSLASSPYYSLYTPSFPPFKLVFPFVPKLLLIRPEKLEFACCSLADDAFPCRFLPLPPLPYAPVGRVTGYGCFFRSMRSQLLTTYLFAASLPFAFSSRFSGLPLTLLASTDY